MHVNFSIEVDLCFCVFSAVEAILATDLGPHIVNERNDDGSTALHLASLNQHLHVAVSLIDRVRISVNASFLYSIFLPLHPILFRVI